MKKESKYAVFLNSVGGALVILLCVIAFNIISAQFKMKADLTEGNLFTLSKGSKELLDGLAKVREGDDESSPLEIRFYLTRGEKGVPVMVNEHGTRVSDLLDQYKAYAGGNLELTKVNPRRDTDAEELAVNDGIRLLNNAFYIGMAIGLEGSGPPQTLRLLITPTISCFSFNLRTFLMAREMSYSRLVARDGSSTGMTSVMSR